MKQTILFICLIFSIALSAQTITTTVKVLPSKDTTIVKFTTTTPTTTYTTTVIPTKDTIVVTPPPPTPGNYGTLIYQNDFESSNDIDPFGHGQAGSGGISSAKSFSGTSSFHALANGNVSSGFRSEVQFNDEHSPMNAAMTYEWMEYLVSIPNGQGLSGQFHANSPSGTSSNGGYFYVGSNKWELVRNITGASVRDGGAAFTIPLNQWVKVRVEAKFTTDNTGYWRTYINDVKVSDASNKVTSNGSGQFFKLGFNWFSNQVVEGYFDNLKIWKK